MRIFYSLSLLSVLALSSFTAKGQTFVTVTTPTSLQGSYDFTDSFTAGGWGADLSSTYLQAEAAFAYDGTSADSLGCEAIINRSEIEGKIAFVYRGSCNYSLKAKNVQDSGAVALVIINNVSGAPVGMGAGSFGADVNIPVVMISNTDGALLRDSIIAGGLEVLIGNLQGVYTVNLGSAKGKFSTNRFHAAPVELTQSVQDHYMEPSIWVYNYGSDLGGVNAFVAVIIDRDGTQLSSETQIVNIPYGDSVQVNFGQFSDVNGLLPGLYTVTYGFLPWINGTFGSDGFPYDNDFTTSFWINEDGVYAKTRVDPIAGPIGGGGGIRSASSTEFEWCIHVKSGSADGQSIESMTFATLTNDFPLTGEAVQLSVYEWNDPITSFDITFDDLVELTDNEFYDYSADLQGEFVTHTFSEPVMLMNDQKYLACATIFTDDMFLVTDAGIDYEQAYNWYPDEVFFPLHDIDGGFWYANGFGSEYVPALILNVSCAVSSTTTVSQCGSYTWNSQTYTQSGTYTYQTIGSGGCDSTATLNLTIIPDFEETEFYTLCDGESVTVNGATYSQVGIYTQFIPGINGCDTVLSIDITADTQPQLTILGNTNIAPNTPEFYAFADPGGYTITWSATNGTVISGQGTASANIFWDATGGGEVQLTLSNNNCSYTYTLAVGTFVGVDNHWLNALSIHPNPSTGIFNMNLNEPTAIEVYDATGRMVLNTSANGLFSLDLSDEAEGTYTVRFSTETGVGVKRIVKN